ncbi:MAG: hypothetical protein Q8P82_00265 [bacterium]|nr:hypothetical protein [bacterium]
MQKISLHILRIGLAITFLWIGVAILRFPESWGQYLQPWAKDLLFIPLRQAMLLTGALDIIIAAILLSNRMVWFAALAGVVHIITVLVGSGVTDITIRDIGLLGASAALLIETLPTRWKNKMHF